jgi:hypothetical protein
MLLSQGFQISTISAPVQPLSRTLTPTGVQVDLSRMEVVWYTEDGTALLWNYMGGKGRWARWTGLEVAGCSEAALVTPDGKLLVEDADAWGDDARGYAFGGRCSNIRPEQLLGGATAMRRVGISGDYLGPHDLRFRIYYNGSPSPSEEFVWSPSEDTWLNTGEDWADLTPAEIDALGARDHSGTYAMTRRLERQSCRVCSVSFSDVNAGAPTYTPIELSFELGAKPGLGKTPVQTINERT